MNIESKIIHYLSQKHHKIGDDCAYLSDTKQLITTDSLLEGVHFDLKYFTDRQIAHRIFLSNYSDILSSGGIPKYALLSVNTPKNKHKRVFNIIKQLEIYLKKYQIELIGGDTTSSKNDINFSLTLLSKQIEKRSILKRSSAKINDNIYTFENIGYSKLGYLSIYKKLKISSKIKGLSQKQFLEPKIYSYHPMLSQIKVNACMDISDGLLTSLEILSKASKIRIIINDLTNVNKLLRKEINNEFIYNSLILTSAEEYVPLFTSQQDLTSLNNLKFFKNMKLKIVKIGEVKKGYGITSSYIDLKKIKSFDHFKNNYKNL